LDQISLGVRCLEAVKRWLHEERKLSESLSQLAYLVEVGQHHAQATQDEKVADSEDENCDDEDCDDQTAAQVTGCVSISSTAIVLEERSRYSVSNACVGDGGLGLVHCCLCVCCAFCSHAFSCVYVGAWVCMYTYICVYGYMCMHVYVCEYIYIYIYICIYMCVYVCMCYFTDK
jgi:hypothetical protein